MAMTDKQKAQVEKIKRAYENFLGNDEHLMFIPGDARLERFRRHYLFDAKLRLIFNYTLGNSVSELTGHTIGVAKVSTRTNELEKDGWKIKREKVKPVYGRPYTLYSINKSDIPQSLRRIVEGLAS